MCFQVDNDQLQSTNQLLQMKLDETQKQLNKVVEENVHLRSTSQRSPTTPTSPLPVIMEPASVGGEEKQLPEKQLPEEEPAEVYAQVDMSKVSQWVCMIWI